MTKASPPWLMQHQWWGRKKQLFAFFRKSSGPLPSRIHSIASPSHQAVSLSHPWRKVLVWTPQSDGQLLDCSLQQKEQPGHVLSRTRVCATRLHAGTAHTSSSVLKCVPFSRLQLPYMRACFILHFPQSMPFCLSGKFEFLVRGALHSACLFQRYQLPGGARTASSGPVCG